MSLQEMLVNLVIGLIGSLFGVGIGGYITYRFSKHYADQADQAFRELKTETERLHHLINTTLLALESMGAKIGRDEKGEATGVVEFDVYFDTLRRVRDPKEPPVEDEDHESEEGV